MTGRAQLVPFPMARRRALVQKLARQMLDRSPAAADKHLDVELRRHRAVLERRNFAPAIVTAQLKALEAAVRTELWRLVMYPRRPTGGAA